MINLLTQTEALKYLGIGEVKFKRLVREGVFKQYKWKNKKRPLYSMLDLASKLVDLDFHDVYCKTHKYEEYTYMANQKALLK